jgi:SWIM zinc finger
MSTKEMLFTKSAASRIAGNTLPHQVNLEVWDKVAVVSAKGQRPKFVSKKDFYQDFVDTRKEAAVDLNIWQNSLTRYTVHNPENGNRYEVTLKSGGTHPEGNRTIECQCKDYQNQRRSLGKGCCKHIYRVLFELGYNSLKGYEAAKSV